MKNYKKFNLCMMMLIAGQQDLTSSSTTRPAQASTYNYHQKIDGQGDFTHRYYPYQPQAYRDDNAQESFDHIDDALRVLLSEESQDSRANARSYVNHTASAQPAAGAENYNGSTESQYARPQTYSQNPKQYNPRPDPNYMRDATRYGSNIPIKFVINHEDTQANKLIELSYFSPKMQQAVLACVNKPFKVNIVTGKVQDIPTVAEIIGSQPVESNIKLNALRAALEATRTGMFLAALNVAYDNPNYILFAPNISSNVFMPAIDQSLKQALQKREADIIAALKEIPEYNSWWSLVPEDLVSMFSLNGKKLQENIADLLFLNFNANINNLEDQHNFVTISGTTLQDLIKNFDYKQKVNPQQAANLLFKQCFIAQQIFENDPAQNFFSADAWPLYTIPTGQIISASNYIFDRFEVTRQENKKTHYPPIKATYAHTIDELCNAISQNAHISPHTPLQAHLVFLRIRKAIQTAIFIANKNSSYNIGNILPSGLTKYLDSIVQQLVKYDEKLSALCKNQQLGATVDDLKRDKIWNGITLFAQASAVIGTVAATIDYGYGSGTSANITANATENAAYYGGKAAASIGSSAVTVPFQVSKGVATGVGSVATGLAKGSYNAGTESVTNIKNYFSPTNKQPDGNITPNIDPANINSTLALIQLPTPPSIVPDAEPKQVLIPKESTPQV